MLTFELPWAFVLLPVPLLVYWLSPEFRDHGDAVRAPFLMRLVILSGRAPTYGAVVLRKGWLQRIAIMLGWILLVIALARPTWVDEPIVQEVAARDMLLVVDLSGSMSVEDFTDNAGQKISRLDAVKQVLREFIERRKTDRLGLAIFGSAAFPQAPFTEDHETVIKLLNELQPEMAGPKTMIGDAVGLAVRLFEASEKKNRVTILLTDGNDSGSQMPVGRAAKIAAEQGIQIHTVAMGNPATVGEDALDLDTLKKVSETTGGRFFLALESAELDTIYAELDRIEPEAVEIISYRPKRALFYYPLAAWMLLNLVLIAFMLLSAERSRVQHG